MAGLVGIKYGFLAKNSTHQLKLGAGILIFTIGGSHFSMYSLDYWTDQVKLIAGNIIDNYCTITQQNDNRFMFNFSLKGNTDINYFFIGHGF